MIVAALVQSISPGLSVSTSPPPAQSTFQMYIPHSSPRRVLTIVYILHSYRLEECTAQGRTTHPPCSRRQAQRIRQEQKNRNPNRKSKAVGSEALSIVLPDWVRCDVLSGTARWEEAKIAASEKGSRFGQPQKVAKMKSPKPRSFLKKSEPHQGKVSSHVRPDPMRDTETLELKHRGLEFKHRVVSRIHYY